jgi:hypothetical protein
MTCEYDGSTIENLLAQASTSDRNGDDTLNAILLQTNDPYTICDHTLSSANKELTGNSLEPEFANSTLNFDTLIPSFDDINGLSSLLGVSSHCEALSTDLLSTTENVSRFSEIFPVEHELVPYDAALSTKHRPPPPPSLVLHSSRALAVRQGIKPNYQTNAMLLFRIIGSFPEMMLRNETLPPFIHPTFLLSNRNDSSYTTSSDPLVACRCLAQLFSSRTKETSGFLWSMIKAESERLSFEVRKRQNSCDGKDG